MSIYWQAIYSDGSILDQHKGAKYQDIDRSRLTAFDLWLHPDKGPGIEPRLLIRVDLRDDTIEGVGPRRLIWRQRHTLSSKGEEFSFHLVGWQRTVRPPQTEKGRLDEGQRGRSPQMGGRNVQAIAYVFEDGAVFLGGQFDERDIFMYSVQKLECEE